MSKYNNPFSVNHRTPLYIDSNDPRAKKGKLQQNIARSGRKIKVKEFNSNIIETTKTNYGFTGDIKLFENLYRYEYSTYDLQFDFFSLSDISIEENLYAIEYSSEGTIETLLY